MLHAVAIEVKGFLLLFESKKNNVTEYRLKSHEFFKVCFEEVFGVAIKKGVFLLHL